jgi:hypothetical protein
VILGARLSPDPRDRNYALALSSLPSFDNLDEYNYYEAGGVVTGQSDVACSWLEWVAAAGFTTGNTDPDDLYREAQLVDPWPGEEPTIIGTDLRSGWRALNLRGDVGEARYLFTTDTIIRCVLGKCPVVCATDWYESFDQPADGGQVEIHGQPIGRHAFLIDGASIAQGTFRIRDEAKTRFPFDVMSYLLGHDGEAMIALES